MVEAERGWGGWGTWLEKDQRGYGGALTATAGVKHIPCDPK